MNAYTRLTGYEGEERNPRHTTDFDANEQNVRENRILHSLRFSMLSTALDSRRDRAR